MNNSIFSDAVFDSDSREAIDLDTDEAAVASNIDAKGFIVKESLEVDLESEDSSIIHPVKVRIEKRYRLT